MTFEPISLLALMASQIKAIRFPAPPKTVQLGAEQWAICYAEALAGMKVLLANWSEVEKSLNEFLDQHPGTPLTTGLIHRPY